MTKLTLAAIQSNSQPGDIKTNIKHHTQLAETAATHSASLIIFPELSLTGYEPEIAQSHSLTPTDPQLQPFQRLSITKNTSILVGAPYKTTKGLHIAAFLYTPNQPPRVYTKHHLHPGEEKYFTPGKQDLSFKIGSEQIAPAICADIVHPEHAATAAKNCATVYAAGVMITPNGYQNDAGLLQGYAKKHKMITLLSNYAGPTGGYPSAGRTAAWDNKGNLIAQAPESGEAIVLCIKEKDTITGKALLV